MNKLFKKLSIVLMIVFCFTLVACNNIKDTEKKDATSTTEGENKDKYPVTIENFNSESKTIEETFKETPKRVISTNQTTTEMLLELGLGQYMVGTSYLDNQVLPSLEKEYNKIPVLAPKYPSKEVVLEKNPDFIIGWKSAFSDKNLGSVSSWNEKGVNTYIQRNSGVLKKCDVENIYEDIKNIGKIFAIEDKANDYIENMKKKIKGIEEKTKKLDKKAKVLVIEGEGDNKYRAYGDNSLAVDMVEKAGGENVCKKSGSISTENIIEMNPDVIVLIYFEQQAKDNKDADSLLNNESLQKVNAIKDKRILYTPLSETYGGGVRTVLGIETMAKGFYPDLFK
ncbi:ABC transporter substrate-binding protein [Clostridium fallax]|uniref:Iron complex transport system substrate-binding protein n=1 Tax=Clostridium fallax TaxID=1533 RepID=A0A1M4VYQ5_9CLOT|nr:ABC transporter substrate-binding protein [Clostridium fallax]SHE74141.1 iron complex transport system substrate-binding protein [Clostridium fallax]SQB07762.1 ABC transporter [Clostridium fallax]